MSRPPTIHRWTLHHHLICADGHQGAALVGYTRDDRPVARYWLGPSTGPAAHVHLDHGRRLAKALGGPLTEAPQ